MDASCDVFVLTADLRTEHGKSFIVLHAASNHGTVEISSDFRPYFFSAVDGKAEQIVSTFAGASIDSAHYLSLSKTVINKISFTTTFDADAAAQRLRNAGVAVFESDVKPRDRFLMDSGVFGGASVTGPSRPREGMRHFSNPAFTQKRVSIPLRVCSIDIETYMSTGEIISIAAHMTKSSEPEQRIVYVSGAGVDDAALSLRFVPDERALLCNFSDWLTGVDPDVVIGWNVIGFDLSVMNTRAEKLRVALPLGRGGRKFAISETSGRFSRAYMNGRVVLDGPQLLRSSFYSFESYSLENVSQSVLGEGKLIHSVDNRGWEIERMYREDRRALAEYNLKDTVLVTQIFQKLKLLELTVKRSELSGNLLDSVGMSVAAFDHHYVPRLHAAGYAAPDVGDIDTSSSAAGGYVMSPIAGIYENVLSLDFQSLYPSIIRTFGIDPLARATAEGDAIETPRGFRFSRDHTILPQLLGELMQERTQAKLDGDATLSQAIKILMNSFYGVMGSSACRFYHPALADAITSTGQYLLTESRAWFEARGDKVLYGDTDSLFIKLSTDERPENLPALGTALAAELSRWWALRLEREYNVDSYLTLEYEIIYRKFLVPGSRGGEGGAKKRYAGLTTRNGIEEVEFVGLEVVRSDWTKLARDFQRELYTKIFYGENVDAWIRDFVQKVRRGELDDKMVYRKRLHKKHDEYGASAPPYVRAARLMKKPSRDVRYVMSKKGPVPIELLPVELDYAHYIDKQLRPVADSILEVMGTSFEEKLSAQLRLF